MKKLILILTITGTFAACNNNQAGLEAEKSGMVAGAIDNPPVMEREPVVLKGKTYTSTSTNPAKAEQKRGWSKAAKGAVIGAGAGALAGAVISKKPVKGAVIGGVIGAGAGYVIGRNKDKKDGRVRN